MLVGKRKLRFVLKKGISILLIAFIFVGAFSAFFVSDIYVLVQKKYTGSRSSFQGVLSLWLVSSYESGTASKKWFLEKVCLEFERRHKGAFVLIDEMTESECETKINSGVMPDIVCYSGNNSRLFESHIVELEEQEKVKSVLLSSARKNGGELYAYPYALGGYALVSSMSRLEKSGVNNCDLLLKNVYGLGYEKKLKRTTKNVYSLAFGERNGNFAEAALKNELTTMGIDYVTNALSQDPKTRDRTSFQAYEYWVQGEAVILLGTQRDIARIENRSKLGRESDFVVNYISYYSDLVDYVSVVQNQDESRQNMARCFSNFLIEDVSQNLLARVGLFSTISRDEALYSEGFLKAMEQSLESLCVVPNIFR